MGSISKLRLLLGSLIIIYILSPIIWKHSPWIQRSFIFMNYINLPYNLNLSHPEHVGLKCTRTLRLINNLDMTSSASASSLSSVANRIEIGTWHILPNSSLSSSCINTQHVGDNNKAFGDLNPIILYIHGNGGNRAANHRVKLYKKLAYEHDNHIVTFDYRGYGDSTYISPTKDSLTLDAKFVYYWLLKQENVNKERITIWAHSLGTAIAIKMLADLPESMRPSRLILEAPFNSMSNAVATHPFTIPFTIIPYFEYFFVKPIEINSELNFDSEGRICDIKSMSIMILHAEDDVIIPMELGLKLYKTAVKKLGDNNVKFVQISGDHNLGHTQIYSHVETMSKVRNFIDREL